MFMHSYSFQALHTKHVVIEHNQVKLVPIRDSDLVVTDCLKIDHGGDMNDFDLFNAIEL